jgi:large subunit ribosomal protein L23
MKQVIIRPVITEKSLMLASTGCYVFAVDGSSDKKQIASRIHALYGVTVLDVHTISMHGKARRYGKKGTPHEAIPWKKAIVRVKKGEKIDAFELKTDEDQTK